MRQFRDGYLKTGKRLQLAIDNADQIEGMQFWLDCHFFYMNLELDGFNTEDDLPVHNDIMEVPYHYTEGAIDYAINGQTEYDSEKIIAQYRAGDYEPENYGDIITIGGIKFKYISSVGLSVDSEHQAEDGECAYEYRGCSYLRILEIVTPGIEVHNLDLIN